MKKSLLLNLSSTLSAIIFLALVPSNQSNQHCSISPKHTLCQFKGVGPRCKLYFEKGVSREERDHILHLHNYFRMTVATGSERRGLPGPQPSSSNMRQMVWDEELAASAQRLADQCKYAHDCLNCRKTAAYFVGQNLYQFSENILREKSNWEQAIRAWYDEVADFHPRSVDRFEFKKELGHYTAMVWADTWKVGCGYMYYNEGKWNRKIYICNYGPAGNIITTPMYKRGGACTECPSGTQCSSQYPGLCSEGTSIFTFQTKPTHVTTRPTYATTTYPTTTTTRRTTTTTRTITSTTPAPIFFPPIESNDIYTDRNTYSNSNNNNYNNNTFNSGFDNQIQTRVQNHYTKKNNYNNNRVEKTTKKSTYATTRPFGRFPTKFSTTKFNSNINNTPVIRQQPTTAVSTTRRPISFSPQIFPKSSTNTPTKQDTTRKSQNSQSNANRYSTQNSSNNRITSNPNSQTTRFNGVNKFSQSVESKVFRLNDAVVSSVKNMNNILLFCDFDYAKCPIRFTGEAWNYTLKNNYNFGRGFETIVPKSQQTNLYIRSVMYPPEDGKVCLHFRFINYHYNPRGGPTQSPITLKGSNGKPLTFRVTAGTLRQKPTVVEITDISENPDDWLTARVQFSNINSMFLLIFQLPSNFLEDNVYLAIDDILVTQGSCHT